MTDALLLQRMKHWQQGQSRASQELRRAAEDYLLGRAAVHASEADELATEIAEAVLADWQRRPQEARREARRILARDRRRLAPDVRHCRKLHATAERERNAFEARLYETHQARVEEHLEQVSQRLAEANQATDAIARDLERLLKRAAAPRDQERTHKRQKR